jgi:hypothetical protein
MKNAQCKKCLRKFDEKDIYTIQQFQYGGSPPYEWVLEFFARQNIGEWDSFCEKCLLHYKQVFLDEYAQSESHDL